MMFILNSFTLSFGVFWRMIFPVLIIGIASSIVWTLLNLISGGYANYLSGPVTGTFVSLFGIRVALLLMGDFRRTDYQILVLYSVLYGVFLLIAKSAALMLADVAAVVFADWQLGDAVSFRTLANAERALQFAFSVYALSAKVVLSLVMYTAVFVVMAVPLAGAARAAGHGTPSASFFYGFGRSFIPLFCVFVVSFFLQFFFELFHFFFAIIPIFVSAMTIIFYQSVPDFDLDLVLKGVAASAGLLWLHAWIWAAAALALLKSDDRPTQPRKPDPSKVVATTSDIRALRKSRS